MSDVKRKMVVILIIMNAVLYFVNNSGATSQKNEVTFRQSTKFRPVKNSFGAKNAICVRFPA